MEKEAFRHLCRKASLYKSAALALSDYFLTAEAAIIPAREPKTMRSAPVAENAILDGVKNIESIEPSAGPTQPIIEFNRIHSAARKAMTASPILAPLPFAINQATANPTLRSAGQRWAWKVGLTEV